MPCHAEDHSAFIFSVSSAISASTAGLSLIFSCWLTCSTVPPAFFSTNASICRNFLLFSNVAIETFSLLDPLDFSPPSRPAPPRSGAAAPSQPRHLAPAPDVFPGGMGAGENVGVQLRILAAAIRSGLDDLRPACAVPPSSGVPGRPAGPAACSAHRLASRTAAG